MTRNQVTESRRNLTGTRMFMLALKFLARRPSLVVAIRCCDDIAENIYQCPNTTPFLSRPVAMLSSVLTRSVKAVGLG